MTISTTTSSWIWYRKSARVIALVLLITVSALVPVSAREFTHTYNFGFDISGPDTSIEGQGSLHLNDECQATAHGTLRYRPQFYLPATLGDARATCADMDGNGIAGLTGFTVVFPPVGDGTPVTLFATSTTGEIDEPGEYPMSFRIDDIEGEGTVRAKGYGFIEPHDGIR